MMRIDRDLRFSGDKRPHRTLLAAHFACATPQSSSAPALSLRGDPGHSTLGGGLRHPASSVAKPCSVATGGAPRPAARGGPHGCD